MTRFQADSKWRNTSRLCRSLNRHCEESTFSTYRPFLFSAHSSEIFAQKVEKIRKKGFVHALQKAIMNLYGGDQGPARSPITHEKKLV
jgi:hypothetical protein